MTDESPASSNKLINKHFVGDAFNDALFLTDNLVREKACAWKIQSSLMHFRLLTDQSWFWRAVNIPLNLVDKSIHGDIDLLFAVRGKPNTKKVKPSFQNLYIDVLN